MSETTLDAIEDGDLCRDAFGDVWRFSGEDGFWWCLNQRREPRPTTDLDAPVTVLLEGPEIYPGG